MIFVLRSDSEVPGLPRWVRITIFEVTERNSLKIPIEETILVSSATIKYPPGDLFKGTFQSTRNRTHLFASFFLFPSPTISSDNIFSNSVFLLLQSFYPYFFQPLKIKYHEICDIDQHTF